MLMNSKPQHKSSIYVYLLLANGIIWLCWLPAMIISAEQGYVLPNFNTYHLLIENGFANAEHFWFGLAFSFGVYGPLIGSLVATWMDNGKAGLADLWRRMTNWKIDLRWYLIAFFIALLMAGLPVVIFALVGRSAENVNSAIPLGFVLFALLMQLVTSGLGEEPGWRGFLLPRLSARFNGEKYIWILGLLWAIWHYPLIIIQMLTMMQNVTPAQALVTIISSLAGQTMSLIGITFIYMWLYNNTRSVFLAAIFHALSNTFSFWLTSYLAQPQSATLFVALMPWAIVLVLGKALGKERFPGTPLNKQVSNLS